MAVETAGAPVPPLAPRSADLALWTLAALAVASPWAFGATTAFGVRALSIAALGVALVVTLVETARGALWLPRHLTWPVTFILALGLAQLLPLPASVERAIAPGSAAVWHPAEPAADALLGEGSRPISIFPAATRAWAGLVGGVCALGLLGTPALARRSMFMRVTWVVVGAGTAVAAYGLVAKELFGTLLFGSIEVPTVAPFGPFVNKNHFAGYVEMPALVALGLGRGLWRHAASSPEGAPAVHSRALVAVAAAATMSLAVLVSMSRGGVMGLAAGLAGFACADALTSRRRRSRAAVLVPVGLLAAAAVTLVLVPREVQERVMPSRWGADASADFRLHIWRDALRAWKASPVVGQGLGAFADVLPRYKTTAGLVRVEHPENEMIELAVEGGAIALAVVVATLGGLVWRSLRAIRGDRDRVTRGVVTGAVAGILALAVHGLVDFNLRIPSNAILCVLLIAMAATPLGSVVWKGRSGAAFALVLGTAAAVYVAALDGPPTLREARDLATKAYADRGAAAALRLDMAARSVREYLAARPADPEGWLLAAWVAAAAGQPDVAAGRSRQAVALDPSRSAVLDAARTLSGPRPPE